MIEGVTEEMHGSDRVPDLKRITSEPWLVEQKQQQKQKLQRERNGALFGANGVVRSKSD
jgi:hypothetical protein